MNKKQYAQYEKDVENFFKKEGLANLSVIEDQADSHFRKSPCECCSRPLGGDRRDCNGYNDKLKEVQGPYSVCEDCIGYSEYGQLDDMTMLEIEDS